MELSFPTNGNRYAIVLQDRFAKWPVVYAAPDRKALSLASLLLKG